jgi:hypothetical protein
MGTQVVQLSYGETAELAEEVMGVLDGHPLGLSIVSCMMIIGRLSYDDITQDEEVRFIQDLSEFIGAYWGEEGKIAAN